MRLAIPAALAAALLGTAAFAQTMDHGAPMHGTMPMHMQHNMPGTIGSLPTQPGQDMFGAVQEIVGMLVADPATDWSKVNLDALREHLIDMNEVALHANTAVERIDGGIRVAATGTGRTLVAIRRMLPEHTREMNGTNGWAMQAESRPDGITVTVTSADAKQVAIIRGLGFIGVMASGGHHQMHHLMMAKGEM
jgi:hypothetical protein